MEGFGAVEEKLEFGIGSAEGFELGGFEGRRLAENPRGDAGFEVFVRACVEVFHAGRSLLDCWYSVFRGDEEVGNLKRVESRKSECRI